MSIRITGLTLAVLILAAYAWKDWFKSLCGLILLMAVIEHEDMPRSIAGIQGLNPWNVLMAAVVLAWLAHRHREGLRWDMPRTVNVLLIMYLGVVVVGFLRALADQAHLDSHAVGDMVSEELINTVKWVVPGLLVYAGCRERPRVRMAVFAILGMYLLIALQVVKRMPWSAALASGSDLDRLGYRLCQDIGYSRCDTAAFLGGASWAMLAAIPLVKRGKHRLLFLGGAGVTAFGQALTGGRAGYVAWMATGLVLCLTKWRKWLIAVAAVVIVVSLAFPGLTERMLQGFGQVDVAGETVTDEAKVTSDRTVAWPHVIKKIGEAPLVGFGRLAMPRTGLTESLDRQYGNIGFPHPHNMYLETLLDNGILGSLPIFLFFGMVLVSSAKLFRSADPMCSAVGGVALSMVVAQLAAGMGSQHFYPRESTLGMWAAMLLALRVSVERAKARAAAGRRPLPAALYPAMPGRPPSRIPGCAPS